MGKKIPNPNHTPKINRGFSAFFSELKDPRRIMKANHLYPLEELLFLSIAAVVSGADSWTSISCFGRAKLDWPRKWYPFENGTPSHDLPGKVFAALDPEVFSRCFVSWDSKSNEITAVPELLELLAIRDCIVTIDAMRCQKSIARALKDKGADYVLMKGSQKELKGQVEKLFSIAPVKSESIFLFLFGFNLVRSTFVLYLKLI